LFTPNSQSKTRRLAPRGTTPCGVGVRCQAPERSPPSRSCPGHAHWATRGNIYACRRVNQDRLIVSGQSAPRLAPRAVTAAAGCVDPSQVPTGERDVFTLTA